MIVDVLSIIFLAMIYGGMVSGTAIPQEVGFCVGGALGLIIAGHRKSREV